MFKEAADIKTSDQLHLPVPEAKFETVVVKPSEIQQDMVKSLSERAAEVHSGAVDPSVDNMLKITSDGRKIGLDQRLMNPLTPDDPDSKLNACVDNVLRIWNETKEDNLTQLIFCDMSTPKGDGSFNVYDDIRTKLLAAGVPESEVEFIHNADTEGKKADLFSKVRSGKVRVLLGSTAKMGAGTNVQTLLVGAAAQLGIFITFVGCRLMGFTGSESSAIGIIGGADGPIAIFVTVLLAPALLGPIAVAAYSYMALVPVIQPPIMKLLTTEKERQIVMKPLREVSKKEKIIFPIVVTIFVALLVPSAAPLIACLMLGNLFKECGITERLSKTVQNELINIVTIFLGVSVGATATGTTFLSLQTIKIMAMGVVAFSFGTAGGVLLAKFMNLFLKEKINPLIGSAGVSAVPMAARVSQMVGQKYNPGNFLLMHAMGPNVAGVIGSAIAAGVLISLYG